MISIKNLALLLAVMLMGFCLVSSVSAMDADDSGILSDSNDASCSSLSVSNEIADSNDLGSDAVSNEIADSNDLGSDVVSNEIADSNDLGLDAVSNEIADSNDLGSDVDSSSNEIADSNDIKSQVNSNVQSQAGSSNENSNYEVLSTDSIAEDSDLEFDLNGKSSKALLAASSLEASTLQAKAKTKTVLVANTYSVNRGDYFKVTLKTSSGKALANQKVAIKVSNTVYNVTTDSKGVASLQIGLKTGKTPFLCTYAGSSAYSPSSLSVMLTVYGKPTTLKATSTTVKKGTYFSVTLRDSSGNPLAKQKVSIKINKATYTLTTDSNGVASQLINLKVGKVPIVCSYAGSRYYKSASLPMTLSVVKNPMGFSISEIRNAATNVKAYVIKNKKLPSTVTVGSRTLKISEFSYLSSKAIISINSNSPYDIVLLSGISNCGASAHSLKSTVYKAQYVDLSRNVVSFIESKKVPPTYASVKNQANKAVGNADFSVYTFASAKILAFQKTEKYLPNYCSYDSADLAKSVSKKSTKMVPDSLTIIRGDPYKVTLLDANGNRLANQKVSITIRSTTYQRTTDSNGVASLEIGLAGGKYSIVSSYAGSSLYGSSKLSKTITVKNSSSRFYLKDIDAAAVNVKAYVNSKGHLPSTVTVANTKLSISQFSYLMSKAIYNINAGSSIYKYITLPSGIKSCNSSGDHLNSNVYKAQYVDLSKRVNSYVESNKVPPVYAKVYSSSNAALGNAEFDLYTFAFSKILVFYKSNGYLPNYCSFESSAVGDSNLPVVVTTGKIKANASQFKNGLNEKNTETDLSKYLVGTGRSAVTGTITNLANKLTKGLSGTDAKALAIYNYVRDDIDYSYYANSRYGASGTLSRGSGNCVDQASLVVSLCRASGIHARYAHAQGCTFSSGLVTGHVWAQILVNGVWYSADATSVRNSLGNVANWNTNSYYSLNKYAAVPF